MTSLPDDHQLARARVWERIRQHVPMAWFMLDLQDMKVFVWDYGAYAVRNARAVQLGNGRLNPDEYFHIWLQQVRDGEIIERLEIQH